MDWLRLLVEAILYYVACMLVARREDAPGIIRVFLTVLLLTVVSGFVEASIGGFWLGNAIVFIVSFIILWVGLGIGFFRTIIAAIIVVLLRNLLERVFGSAPGPMI